MRVYKSARNSPAIVRLRKLGYDRHQALGLAMDLRFAALEYDPASGDLRRALGDAYEATMADWLRVSEEDAARMLADCESAGILSGGKVAEWDDQTSSLYALQKRREAGRKGAEARWRKKREQEQAARPVPIRG